MPIRAHGCPVGTEKWVKKNLPGWEGSPLTWSIGLLRQRTFSNHPRLPAAEYGYQKLNPYDSKYSDSGGSFRHRWLVIL